MPLLFTFRININKNNVEVFGMIKINLNYVTVSIDLNQLITVTVWQKQLEIEK